MSVKLIKVKDIDDGMRLNRWFLKYYPNVTMSMLQKLLRTKQIKVDGKRAEAGTKLLVGQEVRVPPIQDRQGYWEEVTKPISHKDAAFIKGLVIYKDDNILALNKPSGIAVQGGTNTHFHIDGLLDALCFEKEERPKLVHRIDKDTSGILLLARNRKYADILTKGFREHNITKTYLAFCQSCPSKPDGLIDAALEKQGEKNIVSPNGQPAKTTYKTLENVGNKFSLLEASPLTGRTHQIRAHLEYLGCPIIGDSRYYGAQKQKFELFENKLHLHAYKIDLSYIYNKKLVITAQVPEYFINSLTAVGIDFRG